MKNVSHSEQFWPFFLFFGLGSLIIVPNLALGVRLKLPDMSHHSGRCTLEVKLALSKHLLRFSQTCELLSSKAAFRIAFFATLKHRNTQKRIEIHQWQIPYMTFWTRWSKVLFSKRSAKMTDGSEKRNHQFEFHDSHAFEKRSNSSALASRMSLCRKHGFTLVDEVHYLM